MENINFAETLLKGSKDMLEQLMSQSMPNATAQEKVQFNKLRTEVKNILSDETNVKDINSLNLAMDKLKNLTNGFTGNK